MKFIGGGTKKLLSVVLAVGLVIPSIPWNIQKTVAAAETEEITLESVRKEAAEGYRNSTPKSFDLDLTGQSFNGGAGLDYSSDANGAKYMQVINEIRKDANMDHTIIFRFKTSKDGMLLGIGSTNGAYDGKNTVFGVSSGQLRVNLCNTPDSTHNANALKGSIGSGLSNGKYHTVAVSFLPSKGYVSDNIHVAIDGLDCWGSLNWGQNWKMGLNQSSNDHKFFQIGGGSYATDSTYSSGGAFNGNIDFITVIDKGYSKAELEKITQGDLDVFPQMMSGGTCYTWLFTGGTETVADFKTSRTTRNYVGVFEQSLRESGSYIVRSRYVFNTAKRGADVKYILDHFDTMIAPFGTKVVAVMIGADDYEKGQKGLAEFEKNLQALINKICASGKGPMLLTPYPSLDDAKNKNIALYKAVIEKVAATCNSSLIDLSSISTKNIREDGLLTPLGHQEVANKIKTVLNYSYAITSNTYDSLFDGVYTVAKKNADGLETEIKKVIAESDEIQVSVDSSTIAGSEPALAYRITDENGRIFSGNVPSGATEFAITGLKTGTTYTLEVFDVSRTDQITESYKSVSVRVGHGEKIKDAEYPDTSVNEKIQSLLDRNGQVTYLFMGDSITHGVVTQGYDSVPQLFAKYLDEIGRNDDIVLNAGVTNATIATTLDQIDHRLKVYTTKPDVVMIMLGTNDASSNGENVVVATGSTQNKGITVEEFKERYEQLIEHVYENNHETSVVLRVPCDMIGNTLTAHAGYEDKFNAIYDVAENMRVKHPDMNITVVDHLKEWRDYRDNVRNDNIAAGTSYGWLVSDGVHPNGRGNISMFQQIIRELGLYRRTSELANYAYALNEWTGTSDISVSVAQKGTMATLQMSDLSTYKDSLKEVTLTLTDEDGRSFSKTEKYDASGTVEVKNLPQRGVYTAKVTGKDAVTSKEITFVSSLTRTDVPATGIKLSAMDDKTKLTKAGEFVQLIVSLEPENADSAGVTFTSSDPSVATVDENGVVTAKGKTDKDNGKTTITATLKDSDKTATIEIEVAIPVEKSNLSSQVDDVEKSYPEKDLNRYTSSSAQAFRDALNNAKKTLADKNATQEQVDAALARLKNAAQGLTAAPPAPKPSVPANGVSKDVNGLTYKITRSAASDGTVTLIKITKKKANVIIPDTVTIDGYVFRVTAIAVNAFQNNKTVKSVVIPANVKSIGKKAFLKCKKLSKIIFKGAAAPKIGKQAFKGIKAKCKVFYSKKMTAKQLKNLKKRLKKAGIGKKVVYKKK